MKKTLQRLNEMELVAFILAAATIAVFLMIGRAIWEGIASFCPEQLGDNPWDKDQSHHPRRGHETRNIYSHCDNGHDFRLAR